MNTEVVQKQIAELDSLNREMRAWRIGGSIACMVIIILGVAILRRDAMRLVERGPEQDIFFSSLMSNMQQDVLPRVTSLTMTTMQQLVPSVQAEVRRFEERGPELARLLTREFDLLQKEMPQQAQKTLDATLGKVIAEREAKIKQMFPELTPEKIHNMVVNLSAEGEKRLLSVGESLTAPYSTALREIGNDANKIRALEADTIKNRSLAWEMAILSANLLEENLREMAPEEYKRFHKEETSARKEAK